MDPIPSSGEWLLPLEVCENIISLIRNGANVFYVGSKSVTGNISTVLLNCALVCRSWLPRSRILLYRIVHLRQKHSRSAELFNTTILRNSKLGEYVRELHIHPDGEPSNWFYKLHQLPFPNLSHLTYGDLPVVHPSFFVYPKLFGTVNSLELTGMDRWNFRDIVRLLNGFPNLRRLSVDWPAWDPRSPFYCPGSDRRRHTSTTSDTHFALEFDGKRDQEETIENLLHWLIRQKPFSLPREFRLECHVDTGIFLQSQHLKVLISQQSQMLENLTLSFVHRRFYDSEATRKYCENLETCKYCCSISYTV